MLPPNIEESNRHRYGVYPRGSVNRIYYNIFLLACQYKNSHFRNVVIIFFKNPLTKRVKCATIKTKGYPRQSNKGLGHDCLSVSDTIGLFLFSTGSIE